MAAELAPEKTLSAWDKGVYDAALRAGGQQGVTASQAGGSKGFRMDFSGGGASGPGTGRDKPTADRFKGAQYTDFPPVGFGSRAYQPTEAERIEDQVAWVSLEACARMDPGLAPVNRAYGSHITAKETAMGASVLSQYGADIPQGIPQPIHTQRQDAPQQQDFPLSRGHPQGPPTAGLQSHGQNLAQWGPPSYSLDQFSGPQSAYRYESHPDNCMCPDCSWLSM